MRLSVEKKHQEISKKSINITAQYQQRTKISKQKLIKHKPVQSFNIKNQPQKEANIQISIQEENLTVEQQLQLLQQKQVQNHDQQDEQIQLENLKQEDFIQKKEKKSYSLSSQNQQRFQNDRSQQNDDYIQDFSSENDENAEKSHKISINEDTLTKRSDNNKFQDDLFQKKEQIQNSQKNSLKNQNINNFDNISIENDKKSIKTLLNQQQKKNTHDQCLPSSIKNINDPLQSINILEENQQILEQKSNQFQMLKSFNSNLNNSQLDYLNKINTSKQISEINQEYSLVNSSKNHDKLSLFSQVSQRNELAIRLNVDQEKKNTIDKEIFIQLDQQKQIKQQIQNVTQNITSEKNKLDKFQNMIQQMISNGNYFEVYNLNQEKLNQFQEKIKKQNLQKQLTIRQFNKYKQIYQDEIQQLKEDLDKLKTKNINSFIQMQQIHLNQVSNLVQSQIHDILPMIIPNQSQRASQQQKQIENQRGKQQQSCKPQTDKKQKKISLIDNKKKTQKQEYDQNDNQPKNLLINIKTPSRDINQYQSDLESILTKNQKAQKNNQNENLQNYIQEEIEYLPEQNFNHSQRNENQQKNSFQKQVQSNQTPKFIHLQKNKPSYNEFQKIKGEDIQNQQVIQNEKIKLQDQFNQQGHFNERIQNQLQNINQNQLKQNLSAKVQDIQLIDKLNIHIQNATTQEQIIQSQNQNNNQQSFKLFKRAQNKNLNDNIQNNKNIDNEINLEKLNQFQNNQENINQNGNILNLNRLYQGKNQQIQFDDEKYKKNDEKDIYLNQNNIKDINKLNNKINVQIDEIQDKPNPPQDDFFHFMEIKPTIKKENQLKLNFQNMQDFTQKNLNIDSQIVQQDASEGQNIVLNIDLSKSRVRRRINIKEREKDNEQF